MNTDSSDEFDSDFLDSEDDDDEGDEEEVEKRLRKKDKKVIRIVLLIQYNGRLCMLTKVAARYPDKMLPSGTVLILILCVVRATCLV